MQKSESRSKESGLLKKT
jgi:hypothetical protein